MATFVPVCSSDCPENLDEPARQVFEVCMGLCKSLPIKDPTDLCKICKKFEKWQGLIKYLCKTTCKFAKKKIGLPELKEEACKLICCAGKLPEGMPGDECYATLFDENGNPRSPQRALWHCTRCCDEHYPEQNSKPYKMCKARCERWSDRITDWANPDLK
jgi:hypothetical protein